jgi:hypothetical protein
VIDFQVLLFGKDGVKIYVQVSECACVDHTSNVEDIPKIDAFYQNALVQTAESGYSVSLHQHLKKAYGTKRQVQSESPLNINRRKWRSHIFLPKSSLTRLFLFLVAVKLA